jgi:hypothetical protein
MNKIMKNKKIISLIILIVVLLAVVYFFPKFFPKKIDFLNQNSEQNLGKINLTIDYSSGLTQNFTGNFEEGMTAFGFLKIFSQKENFSVLTKDYDFGIFIESIGEKKNGEGGNYWLYYVNGQMPPVAADKYVLKSGDKVEFKFEKSNF